MSCKTCKGNSSVASTAIGTNPSNSWGCRASIGNEYRPEKEGETIMHGGSDKPIKNDCNQVLLSSAPNSCLPLSPNPLQNKTVTKKPISCQIELK